MVKTLNKSKVIFLCTRLQNNGAETEDTPDFDTTLENGRNIWMDPDLTSISINININSHGQNSK